MPFYDSLGNRQPHACSRVGLVVNSLENPENLILVPWIYANTVVSERKGPAVAISRRHGGDVDCRPLLAPELDGVVDEAKKDITNLVRISVHAGQKIMRD